MFQHAKSLAFVILAALNFISYDANAQKVSFDNVIKVYLRNAGPIIKQNSLVGYYFFYFVDKADKQNNNYKLVILDENLNKVAEKDIIDQKSIYLYEASYNGATLLLKFVNNKDKTQTLRTLDLEANELKKIVKPFDPFASAMLSMSKNQEELEGNDVHALDGHGFVNISAINHGSSYLPKLSFTLDYIPNDKAKTGWTLPANKSKLEIPTYLCQNDKSFLLSILQKDGLSGKDVNYIVRGYDITTGKINFEVSSKTNKYSLAVITGTYVPESNSTYIFGNYFNASDKELKASPLGVFSIKIDENGKFIQENYVTWDKLFELAKKAKDDTDKKDIGNIFIHKAVLTTDGRVFTIGERYSSSVIRDIVITEYSPRFEPISVRMSDKGRDVIGLPLVVKMLSPTVQGMIIDMSGGFGYAFTQIIDEDQAFIVGYKYKKENENYFGATSYSNGTYTQSNLSLKTEATDIRVLPAKLGYIMIMEYFKKEKRLDTRLEKIDY